MKLEYNKENNRLYFSEGLKDFLKSCEIYYISNHMYKLNSLYPYRDPNTKEFYIPIVLEKEANAVLKEFEDYKRTIEFNRKFKELLD